MKTIYTIIIAIVAIAIVAVGAIAYMFLSQSPNSQTVKLNGAGATFPYPLLNAMITKYTTQVRTHVQINYQSIGSGGGIAARAAPVSTESSGCHSDMPSRHTYSAPESSPDCRCRCNSSNGKTPRCRPA